MGSAEEAPYSDGLQRLAKLGLPEMKGAEWVKLTDDSERLFASSYQFRELSVRPSGNAWKLATDPPTYLEFGSAEEIEAPEDEDGDKGGEDDSKPGLLGKMLKNYREKNPEPEKKAVTPAPAVSKAAKDAEKITEALGKASVAEEVNNSIGWGNSNLHGRLMLFAAQLHAAGNSAEANALASALFQATENDAAVIDGAISHLADSQYDAAAARFFEDTDWEAYRGSVASLLEKFARGWANAPAVALLHSHLEKRSATPPKPSLPGITLNPDAVALLDKLLEKQADETSDEDLAEAQGVDLSRYPAEQRAQIIGMLRARGMSYSYSNGQPWLLPSGDGSATSGTSPIDKLKAMGMDGLIALAAVATDETLLPIRHTGERDSYYGGNESPAAAIRRRYASLSRPTSRGEIASALLSASIPTPDGDRFSPSSAPDPAELSLSAIEFWKKNKDKSPVELATIYITEGSSTQRSYASAFLSSSEDPAAHAAFEKTVLAADDPLSLIGDVDSYLDARKAAAKGFANAYMALVRENPPSDEDLQRTAAGYQIREAGGLENYLKRLSLKVGDVSLAKMLAEALKAKAPEEGEAPPILALSPAFQSVPLAECLEVCGKAADLASPAQWMEIHQLLRGRIYYELRNSEGDEGGEFQALSENVQEVWRPLIARTDPLPPEGDFPDYARAYGGKTTGDASAIILELATSPGLTYSLNSFAQIEGSPDAVITFARKRVEAWSSGKEPEPWPDAEKVSEDRTKEISSKLAGLKAGEIIAYAKSLNRDERLALMGILSEYGDENPAPPGILELRQTIVSLNPVFGQNHDPELVAKLGIAEGARITPELLTRISDALLADPAANNMTVIMFFPAAMNLGSNILAVSAKDLDAGKRRNLGFNYYADSFDGEGDPEAVCFVGVNSTTDIRTMKDGKPFTRETGNSAIGDFEKSLESKEAVLPYIRITLLTKEDIEKISNQE